MIALILWGSYFIYFDTVRNLSGFPRAGHILYTKHVRHGRGLLNSYSENV